MYHRDGSHLRAVKLQVDYKVLGLEWNLKGSTLAIIQENFDSVTLWDSLSLDTHLIQIGFKDPSVIIWSPNGEEIAVGTKKGNLIICHVNSREKNAFLGKHHGQIKCGNWYTDGSIFLGGSDNAISISDHNGLTIEKIEVKCEPKEILIIKYIKTENDSYIISILLDEEIVLRFVSKGTTSNEPIQMTLAPQLGRIIFQYWQQDCEYLFVGVESGNFFRRKNPFESSEEMDRLDYSLGSLSNVSVSLQSKKFAASGKTFTK